MNRKLKEIAWLTVPIVALAALVPGARLFFDWRDAHQVPRVESCVLRAPTAREASHGASVGYTARWVVPDTGGPFWSYAIEISNANGELWTSNTPAWNRVAVASDERDWANPDAIAPGNADNRNGVTVELRGGLKWKRIAGNAKSVRVKISLWPNDGACAPQVRAARIFTLEKPKQTPNGALSTGKARRLASNKTTICG